MHRATRALLAALAVIALASPVHAADKVAKRHASAIGI